MSLSYIMRNTLFEGSSRGNDGMPMPHVYEDAYNKVKTWSDYLNDVLEDNDYDAALKKQMENTESYRIPIRPNPQEKEDKEDNGYISWEVD